MYTKENLYVNKIASKSSIKVELATIGWFGDRTVATDSFRLLEVPANGEKLEDPIFTLANSVKVAGVKGEFDEPIGQKIDVQYPDVDQVIDMFDKKQRFKKLQSMENFLGSSLSKCQNLIRWVM